MSDPLLHKQAKVRQGAYLPHWTIDGAIYHVVFRLGDALPAKLVEQFRAEQDALLVAAAANQPDSALDLPMRLRGLYNERIESVLDNGLGACWLGRDEIAELTANALQHFNGSRYTLHAWCVMPNLVHVIVQPMSGHELPAILKSWKGFTAHEANHKLGRSGEFWQPEYYDHLIRGEGDLARSVRYVQDNPRLAGRQNWRWLWPPEKE